MDFETVEKIAALLLLGFILAGHYRWLWNWIEHGSIFGKSGKGKKGY